MDDDLELKAEDFHIFPTVVTRGNIPKSLYDKDVIMDMIVENLDDNGQTMDFIGNGAFIHHDERLNKIYNIIVEYLKYHFSLFALNPNDYQIYIVKSWFNVNTKDHRNAMHTHNEADYSVTFYPHVPAGSKKWLRLIRPAHYNTNEIFPGQWFNWSETKNYLNANEWIVMPEEGDVMIFPASLEHDTINEDFSDSNQGNQTVASREDLQDMRICIGVDVKLTAKTKTLNYKILQPVSTWRTFD